MKTYRKTAIAVGILFILATVTALLGSSLASGVAGAGDHLGTVAARGDRFVGGAILTLLAGVCCVLIAALLFPVLRRVHEGIALGYFGLRIMEAMTLVVTTVSVLLLVTLGRQSLATGVPADSLRGAATVVEGLHDWAFPLNPIVFTLGAVLLYSMLYTARLVPRWLSVWGLAGAAAVCAFALMKMYGGGTMLLALPIGVQEMVLACWLIAKGFDAAALASLGSEVSSETRARAQSAAGPRAPQATARGPQPVPVLDRPGTQA
jgi:hypothetical protein